MGKYILCVFVEYPTNTHTHTHLRTSIKVLQIFIGSLEATTNAWQTIAIENVNSNAGYLWSPIK